MDIPTIEARRAQLLIAVYAGPGPALDADIVELLELERKLDAAKATDGVTAPHPFVAGALDAAEATSSLPAAAAAAESESDRTEREDLLVRRAFRSRVAAIVFGGLLMLQCASMIVADAVPAESGPATSPVISKGASPEWCRSAALSVRNDPITAARLQQGCDRVGSSAADHTRDGGRCMPRALHLSAALEHVGEEHAWSLRRLESR